MAETRLNYKKFWVATGAWTYIPDLGIDVYQNTGYNIYFKIYPDNSYTCSKAVKYRMRRHSA